LKIEDKEEVTGIGREPSRKEKWRRHHKFLLLCLLPHREVSGRKGKSPGFPLKKKKVNPRVLERTWFFKAVVVYLGRVMITLFIFIFPF